jgi:hypothetical protein
MATRTTPSQVAVYSPEEVSRAIEQLHERGPDAVLASTALVNTERGDRAAIYESEEGRGIVAGFDFCDVPVPQDSWGWMAPGILQPLDEVIPRERLIKDEVLASAFTRIHGRRSLTPRQGRRIEELVGALPAQLIDREDWGPGEFDGPPAKAERSFGNEAAMQAAILNSPSARESLGFASRPQPERWSDDLSQRYDLISVEQRIVAELKIEGRVSVVGQVDNYLDTLTRDFGEGWMARIVVASRPSVSLLERVRDRPDVELWRIYHGGIMKRED